MPDFTLQITGATVENWTDTATPSRLNPRSGRSMHRYLCAPDDTVTLTANLNGIVAPLDSALAGNLFYPFTVQRPDMLLWIPAWSSPSGQSSVQSTVLTQIGMYTFYMRHAGGGSVLVHVECWVTS